MTDNWRNRRRNFFIKKEFQRNFIMKFCVVVILGSLISGGILYWMSKSTVTTTFENSRLTIKSTADYILPSVILSSLVVILGTGVATIFITLFTSHKIAGPLYRMEKDVQEFTTGNLNVRFGLRQDDELKLLASSLDIMAVTMKTRVSDIKKAVVELESAVESSKMAVMSEKAKEKLQNIKIEISKFKI